MPESIVEMDWADVEVGMRVRWSTPKFVRRGEIINKLGGSLKLMLDGHHRETIIPNAQWYYEEAKSPLYKLEVVEGEFYQEAVVTQVRSTSTKGKKKKQPSKLGATNSVAAVKASAKHNDIDTKELISVSDACNLMGVDAKTLRRHLRSGKVQGVQQGGRWVGVVRTSLP